MVMNIINILCPGPSRTHLFNDIFILLAKDGDKEWHDDQRNMKSKYTELVSALCSCTKVAKKNTIEQKVFRAILNKGTTNDELSNFMKEYQFTFAVGKVQRIDQLINKNECENVHDIITKFMPPHSWKRQQVPCDPQDIFSFYNNSVVTLEESATTTDLATDGDEINNDGESYNEDSDLDTGKDDDDFDWFDKHWRC